ncbi:MAG: VOC family protein [Hyphomicrobiaceae bacterium]
MTDAPRNERPRASPSVLETALYARDLVAAERFWRDAMGLEPYQVKPGRHVFYRLESQMLLIFNPDVTSETPRPGAPQVPPHGTQGEGHVCFAACADEMDAWRHRLAAAGVDIEADLTWPGGGRSLYFRDPAGNSIEIAEPRIWGL